MDIGKILKKHMENAGFSIKEMAKKSGVSESTIKRILIKNGENVRIETIARLCFGLSMGLSDFFQEP